MSDINLSRRTFLKASGALGAVAAASGGLAATGSMFGSVEPQAFADAVENETWGHCAVNCPGRCALRIHTKDDEITWVGTYTSPDAAFDDPQPRACLRGRTYRRWMNDPNRINYPMKRTGVRGDGKYERIGWDEAIDTVASKLKEVIDKYGNEAVYIPYATGVSCTTSRPFFRMMAALGGYLGFYGDYSNPNGIFITPYIYGEKLGTYVVGSTLSCAEDSKVIVVFGSSPTETRQGGAIAHYDWVHLREKNPDAKIYMIDPRLSDSAMGYSDEWLPINPGTDAALVSALAHEFIVNGHIDQEFLDNYCVGFDETTMPEGYKDQNLSYKDYVMGTGYDKVEKTPEWAESITGISADKIRELAEDMGTNKPVYVLQGWGSQRRSNGEMTSWAIMTLPCLIGQIGLPGTNSGARETANSFSLQSLSRGTNPIKTSIPCFMFTDAIDHGTEMTAQNAGIKGADRLKTNIKYMINYAGNCLTNQHSDINKAHDILSDDTKCEFILGINTVMCDSMKYSDIILPDLFRSEQESMIAAGGDNPYMLSTTACTAPKFERKTAYEMAAMIADKFGKKEEFTGGKTESEWIRDLYEQSRAKDPTLPTFDEFQAEGVYVKDGKKKNPLEKFRTDPVANALDTPSGKIEIFSAKLLEDTKDWEFEPDDTLPGMTTMPGIPVYIPEWYGVSTTTEENPLMLTGFHYRGRTHSCWGSVEELKEVNPQEAWINPVDAEPRGIKYGDKIHVTNQFGEIELLAKVTPRIVPGVVAVSQGAWHDADMNGNRLDKGGCINTLTTQRPSPLAKGNPQHTNICNVKKA